MQLEHGALVDIRLDVREALENRERMFTAMGYIRVDGEWVDASTKRPITPSEVRTLYRIGDDSVTRLRKARDAKWPWPSTHVPF